MYLKLLTKFTTKALINTLSSENYMLEKVSGNMKINVVSDIYTDFIPF